MTWPCPRCGTDLILCDETHLCPHGWRCIRSRPCARCARAHEAPVETVARELALARRSVGVGLSPDERDVLANVATPPILAFGRRGRPRFAVDHPAFKAYPITSTRRAAVRQFQIAREFWRLVAVAESGGTI